MSNPTPLTLHEVADRLGVHYMTVYKYVRTGKLPATKSGAQWQVSEEDVVSFERRPSLAPVTRPDQPVDYADRLVAPLVAGDEAGAWTVIDGAMAAGVDATGVYVSMLAPAMREIGDRWAAGSMSIAAEHRATAIVHRLIGRLGPQMRRPGRSRGSVVVGAAPEDHHALPVAMLADLLRRQNFDVADLGSNVPVGSFVEAVEAADRLVAVGISVSVLANDDAIASVVRVLRPCTTAPIVLGGWSADAALVTRVGADRYVPGDEVVAYFDWRTSRADEKKFGSAG